MKKTLEEWNRERSTDITMPELALRFILGNDGREHDHSRDAKALARGSKHRGERRRTTASGVAGKNEGLPLGAKARSVVSVRIKPLEIAQKAQDLKSAVFLLIIFCAICALCS